ncbi:MAG: Na+/H+ antiporter NhaA [Proteobacteria bacterium]|nr:Na+/H+ antiporter NhaA [Pseudomonadota bacterium]
MSAKTESFATRSAIIQFFNLETSGVIILAGVTLLALIISNTPLYALYREILTTPVIVQIGSAGLNKPILLWINDGLMAIFFCLIAIEIKRKVFAAPDIGWADLALPSIGALGGIAIPALIYLGMNLGYPEYHRGWAIPTATDIAFSLGVLMSLGSRVPESLKLFLIMLAVLDDLAAIIVIAVFYTDELSLFSLGLTAIGAIALLAMNRFRVRYVIAYIWLGIFMWVCMVKSGVHATLTGVILGFALPMGIKGEHGISPSMQMEHDLKYWVTYMHLPLFAFANAGVPLAGASLDLLLGPVPMGIALGLLIGKPLGVTLFVWLGTVLKLVQLPQDANWTQFIGVAVLTGIGFTMSLFIGTLAFGEELIMRIRLGVLAGSFLAATIGYLILRAVSPKPSEDSVPV